MNTDEYGSLSHRNASQWVLKKKKTGEFSDQRRHPRPEAGQAARLGHHLIYSYEYYPDFAPFFRLKADVDQGPR